ncbi:tail fiber assembly protein [Serratia liquefaciens]|uniref:tail fiber assembly protein n=1 Tax=Serratia liquefaciens TaxID=614 RepID=UPI003905B909
MAYFYSPFENIVYPDELMAAYSEADTLASDLIEITDAVFKEYFIDLAPEGKYRIANSQGLPAWADIAPPSKETLIAIAEAEKQNRQAIATTAIAPLQDAVDLNIATDEEKQQLMGWKKYRVSLNRVDTSTAPDIAWPEQPK